MADGGRAIVPGDGLGGGNSASGRGSTVNVDTATSRDREEEAGQLQRDNEEEKQTANQRHPRRLQSGGTNKNSYKKYKHTAVTLQ